MDAEVLSKEVITRQGMDKVVQCSSVLLLEGFMVILYQL
jgi:hypothetical protein